MSNKPTNKSPTVADVSKVLDRLKAEREELATKAVECQETTRRHSFVRGAKTSHSFS
jgi:hypothetical protein